jgi:23S rRNA (cytidine1920-2'-O)/16S rRNA (cytidine1409-2'-O)-methyltransferase
MDKFVSRGGEKLQFALENFPVNVRDKIAADFGSSTGGFTDCLLQAGARKVYSVDTSYGELAWKLRNDPRVIVMERTNAMHVSLPEKADIITIDTGWTRQKHILPNAFQNLKEDGVIISLIKPHYEASGKLVRGGKLLAESVDDILDMVKKDIGASGGNLEKIIESPILGERAGNREFLALIKRA